MKLKIRKIKILTQNMKSLSKNQNNKIKTFGKIKKYSRKFQKVTFRS